MDNLEDFLAPTGESETAPVEETTEVVETQEPETEAQAQQRERDEKGRFKPKETTEPVMVPLQALHETRDEVKALKAQLETLRQPQAQPEAPQVPDIFENPEGYTAHIQNQIAQTALNDRLNLSEELVRQSAGDETVNAATEWAKPLLAGNPMFAQVFYAQRNPYGFLVREFQRQQTVAQIGDDPKQIEEFMAWKQAKAAPAQQQPVPTSLADAQSSRGGSEPFTAPTLDQILGRTT